MTIIVEKLTVHAVGLQLIHCIADTKDCMYYIVQDCLFVQRAQLFLTVFVWGFDCVCMEVWSVRALALCMPCSDFNRGAFFRRVLSVKRPQFYMIRDVEQ